MRLLGWSLAAALLGLQGALAGEQVAQAPAKPAASPAGGGIKRAVGIARAGVRYLPAAALDVRPQVASHVNPEYPKELKSGTRGRVVLDLFISRDGKPDRVQVARAEPAGRFEESALKAFAAARFSPGMKNGIPFPSLMRVEVNYGD